MQKDNLLPPSVLDKLEELSVALHEFHEMLRPKYLTDSRAASAQAPEKLADRAMLVIAHNGSATIGELVDQLQSNTTSVRRALFELFDDGRIELAFERIEHTRRLRAYCPHLVTFHGRENRKSDIAQLRGSPGQHTEDQDWAAGDE